MIKLLLCGEGPTDYGKKIFADGKWGWIDGPAQIYIKKVLPVEDIEIDCLEKQAIKKLRLQRIPSKVKGHGIKAFKLAIQAREQGIGIAVCYVDADNHDFDTIYQQIAQGFDEFGSDKVVGIPMIPKRMIESWLLADEGAFNLVFGVLPVNPSLPAKPEEVWGAKEDTNSNFPKNLLARVIGQYPAQDRVDDKFIAISENSDVEVLRSKCPLSFGRFFNDMSRVV